MPATRTALSFLAFFVTVVALSFVGTFVHEVSHAGAWGELGSVQFHENREAAEAAITHQETRTIDGRTYRVQVVDQTTVALYPKAILVAGMTLGLAPANLLPEPTLGSTFYALDDAGFEALARGESATQWHHAAMPMMVNAALAIPIFIWLLRKPNFVSMAAAWVNASEWRFNAHHAQEIGLPSGLYLGWSILLLVIVAGWIGIMANQHKLPRFARLPVPSGRSTSP
jgi:hypothetical protein